MYGFVPAVAAQVMTKAAGVGHTLQKHQLQVDYAEVQGEEPATEEYVRNKLLVHNIPEGVDEEFLELYLVDCLETDTFSVHLSSGQCTITFPQEHSVEGTSFLQEHKWCL